MSFTELWKSFSEYLSFLPNELMYLIFFYLLYHIKKELKNNKESFIANVKEITKEQYVLILKILIMDERIPRINRLEYYDEYKNLGGNSFIDHYVDHNILDNDIYYGRRVSDKTKGQDEQ